jgi:hypothetical protein
VAASHSAVSVALV